MAKICGLRSRLSLESDVGSDLYVMEQYHDYRMTDDRPVVKHAHEI